MEVMNTELTFPPTVINNQCRQYEPLTIKDLDILWEITSTGRVLVHIDGFGKYRHIYEPNIGGHVVVYHEGWGCSHSYIHTIFIQEYTALTLTWL